MCLVKDQLGREIEIAICGDYDDIHIDEAYYIDFEEEVTDETIEYILDTQYDKLSECWFEKQQGLADHYFEQDR